MNLENYENHKYLQKITDDHEQPQIIMNEIFFHLWMHSSENGLSVKGWIPPKGDNKEKSWLSSLPFAFAAKRKGPFHRSANRTQNEMMITMMDRGEVREKRRGFF